MTLRDLLNKYPEADLSTVYIHYMNDTYDKVSTTIPGHKFFSGDIDIDIPQLKTATYDWKVATFVDDPEKEPIEERKLSITLADRVLDFESSKKVIKKLKKEREENASKDKNLYKFIDDLIITVAYASMGSCPITKKAKDIGIDRDWFKNSVCYTRFQVLTYTYEDDMLADDFYQTLSYEVLNGKLTLSQVLYPTASDEENFFKLFEEMLDDDISEEDLLDYCGEEDPDDLPDPRRIWEDEEILIKAQKLFQEFECKIKHTTGQTLFKQGMINYKNSCGINYHCALVQIVVFFNGKAEYHLLEQQNFDHIKKYIDIKEEK